MIFKENTQELHNHHVKGIFIQARTCGGGGWQAHLKNRDKQKKRKKRKKKLSEIVKYPNPGWGLAGVVYL